MNPLQLAIRSFDRWLSRVEGVVPFSQEPSIILRLQRGRTAWEIPLPDHHIPARSPALLIHLWNERMPPLGSQGADVVWALQFERRLLHSFRAVATYLRQTPSLNDVQAVGGTIAHIHLGEADGGRRLLEDLGFTLFPYHRPAGAFGEFWENFFTWMLLWAYNPPSLRSHALLTMQRSEFWTTREAFLARFIRSQPQEAPRVPA